MIQQKSIKRTTVSAFLGGIGAANSVVIGFYLISTMLAISNVQGELYQTEKWIIGIATAITVAVFVYGSLLLYKGDAKKGWKINMVATLILAGVYVYYSIFSQLPVLSWLNPGGILLVIPPIFSVILGLLS